MQLSAPLSQPPRLMLLLLLLMMIGGTACFTPRAPTAEEVARQQRLEEVRSRERLEKLQGEVAAGDPIAAVRLANYYLYDQTGRPRDFEKGRALLEQFAPISPEAKTELGWLLLDGRTNRISMQYDATVMPRDPARGFALLLGAVPQTVCTAVPKLAPGQVAPYFNKSVEWEIAFVYRDGGPVAPDEKSAELWRARSLVHCQYPDAAALANRMRPERNPKPSQPLEVLAQLMLLPPSPQLDALKNSLTPEEVQSAERKASQLRDAVSRSEQQYPAPSTP